MIDQIFIGNVGSCDEYGASVAERRIIKPKKKSIKETVPFSNVTHDFSAINGEIYWEEGSLEYVFEIIASSAEELEDKKRLFCGWIMNVMEQELHDPFIRGYHFKATYDDMDIDDSEIEKATITVTFTTYPYMISDVQRVYAFKIKTAEASIKINSKSSHRITPVIQTDVECVISKDSSSYAVPVGTVSDDKFMLVPGENILKVKSTSGSGTLKIAFHDEVF